VRSTGCLRLHCPLAATLTVSPPRARVRRPPPPAGTAAVSYLSGLTRRETSTSVAYALCCGAAQLKRYFEDMRELVLEISEIEPPARPYDPPRPRAPLRAFAYLHLGLAHLDVPFRAVLPCYALAPGQEEEIARVSICLATVFASPTAAPPAATDEWDEGWGSHGGEEDEDEYNGEHYEAGNGVRTADPSAAHFARRVAAESCSVASSFALNEKRALFDENLPVYPGAPERDPQRRRHQASLELPRVNSDASDRRSRRAAAHALPAAPAATRHITERRAVAAGAAGSYALPRFNSADSLLARTRLAGSRVAGSQMAGSQMAGSQMPGNSAAARTGSILERAMRLQSQMEAGTSPQVKGMPVYARAPRPP